MHPNTNIPWPCGRLGAQIRMFHGRVTGCTPKHEYSMALWPSLAGHGRLWDKKRLVTRRNVKRKGRNFARSQATVLGTSCVHSVALGPFRHPNTNIPWLWAHLGTGRPLGGISLGESRRFLSLGGLWEAFRSANPVGSYRWEASGKRFARQIP